MPEERPPAEPPKETPHIQPKSPDPQKTESPPKANALPPEDHTAIAVGNG